MASYQAVSATCDAIIYLLRTSYDPAEFGRELQFRVFLTPDFGQPMEAGVSLFLYRVYPNGTHRHPAGRVAPNGDRQPPLLPLDLHFILTAWGADASLQHRIVGWMMRVIEDNPILPSGLLNTVAPGTFQSAETVELSLADLRTEDMLRIWDTVVQNVYQLSIPYVARNVWIESLRNRPNRYPLVTERTLDITDDI